MMRLLRILADNLLTFLVALTLASVIWVVAPRGDDPVVTRAYEVPVTVANQAVGVILLGDVEDTVQVVVEGRTSLLDQIETDNFQAVVDLALVTPLMDTPLDIVVQFSHPVVAPADIVISPPFPSQTIVTLDRLITEDIPVVVTMRGSVARGYERGEAFAEPAFVQVTGPSSRVNDLAEARLTVILDNVQEDVVVIRRPVYYDQSGDVASISGLTTSIDQIEVTVPVDQLAGFANKPITVVWTGDPAPGYRLLNVTATPDSVLVTGTPSQLEALQLVQTEVIDISGLQESFTQQVALALPESIELEEVQPIIINVVIEPILSTTAINRPPEIRALTEGLTATLSVDEVRVVLFGPLPILDTLVPNDVRVTLDLFNLEPGTYSIAPIVDVPAEEITVRSTQPAQVTVVISDVITTTNDLNDPLPLSERDSLRLQMIAASGVLGGPIHPDLLLLAGLHFPAALLPKEISW